jgi:hypothetical protein
MFESGVQGGSTDYRYKFENYYNAYIFKAITEYDHIESKYRWIEMCQF